MYLNSFLQASAKVRLSLRGILTRLDKDSGSRVSGDETEKLQEIVEVAKSLLDSVAI